MVLEEKADCQALLKLSQQQVKRDPANAAAWYSVGAAFAHLKQYSQAVQAYREALHIQPENPGAWYNLGVNYALLGERGKIRGVYQALRKLDPSRAERYFNAYMLP